MHDLVHDLARSVMEDEILVVGKGDNTEGSSYHYALLHDRSNPSSLATSKLRALRIMECGEIEFSGSAFSNFKSMRVLDLSECSMRKLPDSIGVLKQLRYLNAPRLQDAVIPNSPTRLSKLIYLNLHGSSRILALPESIGDIEGLVYLDLSGCSRIEKIPKSFSRLKELVHLDISNCTLVEGILAFLGSLTQLKYLNLSYCPRIGGLPGALGGASNLQYLNLSFSSCLKGYQEAEALGALTKLEYLNLSSCDLKKLPEALGRFTQLKYLNLSGCSYMEKLPRLFGNLESLGHLDLSMCHNVDNIDEALVGLTSLQYLNLESTDPTSLPDGLTKLRYLKLSRMNYSQYTMVGLINNICSNLSDLEHLDLSHNIDITSIPESLCSLRKLQTLDLSHCPRLQEIPKSVGTIDSLKFLYLNGCDSIKELPQLSSSSISLPNLEVQAGDGDSSSNLVQLQHKDPGVLHISKLENVKSSAEAHCVNLVGKQNLGDLSLEWTRDVERFVDDKMFLGKLIPPRTLKKLEICGYNGVSFPAWLVLDQLPDLESLVLRGMANLEEWNTSYCSGEEFVIQSLEIHDCPMLRMKPLPPRAKYWKISNSDNLLSSWEECTMSHSNASSSSSPVTTILSVRDCKVPVHKWRLLQHFSGLTVLSISKCGDLTGSAETNQHLSSLETLSLYDPEELPNWTGELTSL